MKRDNIPVPIRPARLSLLAAVAFFYMLGPSVAQESKPEIYVDMDVLEQLDPGMQQQQQVPVRLKPPTTNTPDGYVSKPPSMPDDPVRRVILSVPATRLTEPLPDNSGTVSFPIKTRMRTETSDPSVNSISRPVPIRSGIAGNLQDNTPSRPAPDFDPGVEPASKPVTPVRDLTEKSVRNVPVPAPVKKAATTEPKKRPPVIPVRKPPQNIKLATLPVIEQDTTKTPVVPPKRPDIQKASPELVAQLRAREESKKLIPLKNAEVDPSAPLPPPGPMGRKNMPAVAKAPVDAEALAEQTIKLAVPDDPLLGRLVEKDKEALVATIESMVAEREDGTKLPESDKPKRELGSNIVKAQPLQRPYNVYRPQKDDKENTASDSQIEKREEEIKIASLPSPKAAEDSLTRITLPFATGNTEIDEKTTNEIEARLLPVLNNNPGWKLQIHAFAAPTGKGSARKESLARGMAVRAYLMNKGIDATRMDVRALGAEGDSEPRDRVDLIVFDPAKKS